MSHDHHDAAHEGAHGSLRDYLVGFTLAVILTAIPFWLVMERPLPANWTAALVIIFAAVQVVVHMIYFLHMKAGAEDGWTMTSLVFTVIVVVITIAGSAWVMYHMNTNMMPMMHGAT
ncbi:cytochrome o ubiquinol oxidase subunit IV [Rhodovarius crocodyli]|uniref:Cytochrome bo(3) ubiquinol oxidase subunit 4 n=1 Tax=Rhodovarius crocodyli TaxID=1979269 RepID=A0A437MG44_9PROT|nr:cytochrome o ubiquinol oxidase subunit IV [Rhodovarius crocodyli]RVT96599.1 cytochrome o ubiquinol oxidase subunit IV [Rhodovarius crocodyli]